MTQHDKWPGADADGPEVQQPQHPELSKVEPPATRRLGAPEGMRVYPEMIVPQPGRVQTQDAPERTQPDEQQKPGS